MKKTETLWAIFDGEELTVSYIRLTERESIFALVFASDRSWDYWQTKGYSVRKLEVRLAK